MFNAKQYTDLFVNNRSLINNNSAQPLNNFRDIAFDDLCRLGFPTNKVERYKYTDVPGAFSPNYGLNFHRHQYSIDLDEMFRCNVPNLNASLYFILNDSFYSKFLPRIQPPQDVIVCSLRQAAIDYPEKITSYYAQLARTNKDAINAFNTMFVQDGVFIYIPAGVKVEKTIQLVNILRANVDLMANRRVLVIIDDNSEAGLLFCDHVADEQNFLTTQVIEIFVGQNSRLELYELEETHVHNKRFSNIYINQQSGSITNLYNITLHNGLTRNRADIILSGEHAETNLYGCVVADKSQHVDNNTLIDIQSSMCKATQLYKYVLEDSAVGAFAGRVLVRNGAQHSVSDERNANLCTTSTAHMYTQPMLEIYADDVKCSHGSTVGQLDEQSLFYMQQRGINRDEAVLLLKFAFLAEVINSISLPAMRDRLLRLVENRFRGELSRCSNCKLCK